MYTKMERVELRNCVLHVYTICVAKAGYYYFYSQILFVWLEIGRLNSHIWRRS
jgi:hypothetical protein